MLPLTPRSAANLERSGKFVRQQRLVRQISTFCRSQEERHPHQIFLILSRLFQNTLAESLLCHGAFHDHLEILWS